MPSEYLLPRRDEYPHVYTTVHTHYTTSPQRPLRKPS